MSEIEAFAILASIPNLGAVKIRLLMGHFGSAIAALQAPTSELSNLPGFERLIPHWEAHLKNGAWKNDLALAQKNDVQIIPYTSPQFPKSLLEIPDHPAILYVHGNLKCLEQRTIAIVGTRNASIYALEMAHTISQTLAANGFTVISGLARGIDTAAHRGALTSGCTAAVIGSGLACIYPAENQGLAKELSHKGALISEFPMNTPPDRQNFPQRNRIVSGLSQATVLIEAPIKSGAMITMDRARLHKRKLFALPGRADSDSFRGNHMLIKSGQAQLIENAEDIMQHFDGLFLPMSIDNRPPASLDPEETRLYEKMPQMEVSIDELATLSALPIQQVQRILMSLILKKAIKEFPGKVYKKLVSGHKH